MAPLALGALLLGASLPAAAAPIRVEADRIVLDDGTIRAEGQVRIDVDGRTIRGDSATATEDRVVVERARTDGLTADRLVWTPEDLVARGASWTACDCDGIAPWRVTADEATLTDEAVKVSRAWIRVLELPVLPVPRGTFPTERRSGLLLPELGWGEDGVQIAQPLYLALGPSADLTLTPELWTERTARLRVEARRVDHDEAFTLRGALGPDFRTDTWRGAVGWEAHSGGGATLLATHARWSSDADWYTDYGRDYLSRATPYDAARALAAAGPMEAGASVYGAPDSRPGETPLRVAAAHAHGAMNAPATDLPGGLVGATRITTLLDTPPGTSATLLEVDLERPTRLGPLHATPLLRGVGAASSPDAAALGVAGVDLRLPAWRTTGRALEHLEPRITVLASAVAGPTHLVREPTPPVTTDQAAPWTIRPALGWRRTTGTGLVEIGGAWQATPDRHRAEVHGRVQQGPWSGWLDGWLAMSPRPEAGLGTAGLAFDPGPVGLEGSWSWISAGWFPAPFPETLHQAAGRARWTLPGPLDTLTLTTSARADLVHPRRWLHRGAGFRWAHPSGCLTLGADLWLDADRASPDLAVAIQVVP